MEQFKQDNVVLWIEKFTLRELNFKVTFAKDPTNRNKLISNLLGSIGAQFVNLENANISLDSIELN